MLSIVILNYNTRELLSENLRCIQGNTKDIEHEVIIVDNGSTDGSVEFIKKNFSYVNVVKNPCNIGASAGRIKGFSVCRGDYILSLDSDTFVGDNCVSTLIEIMNRDKNIGVVGCKLLNRDGTIQYSAKRFPNLLSEFLNIFFFGRIFLNSKFSYIIRAGDFETVDVDWVSGALGLFRREAYEKAGGFDERFFYGGEDADICYRIKKLGYRVVYTTKCSAVHLGGGTTSKIMNEIYNAPHLGKVLFFEKHYGSRSTGIVKLISFFQTITELFGFCLNWLLFPRKRARASFAIVERRERLKHFLKSLFP